MRIKRGRRPDAGWLTLDNRLLRDPRISDRARGLLSRILSYPDDWSTDSETLAAGTVEGREAVRTALKELEAAGYLVRTKTQDPENGQWSTTAEISAEPVGGWPEDPTPPPKPKRTPPRRGSTPPTPKNPSSGPTPKNPPVGDPAVGDPDVGSLGAIRKTETKDGNEDTHPSDVCERDERADTQTQDQSPPPRSKPRSGTAKRAVQMPDGFGLDDGRRNYAINKGIPPAMIDEMFEHFANHHASKGSRFVDWNRAWMTWVQNSRRWGQGPSGAAGSRGGPPGRPPMSAAAERQAALDDFARELAGEASGLGVDPFKVLEGEVIR